MSETRPKTNVEIATRMIERLSNLDIKGCEEFMDRDMSFEIPFLTVRETDTQGRMRRGPQDCIATHSYAFGGLRSLTMRITGTYECPEQQTIVLETASELRFVAREPDFVVRNNYVYFFKFRDGMITTWRYYFDSIVANETREYIDAGRAMRGLA